MEPYKLIHKLMSYNSSLPLFEDNQLFKPNSNDDQDLRKELELKKLGKDWPIGCQVKVKQATDINHDEWTGTVVKILNLPHQEPLLVKFEDEHSSPIELENYRDWPEFEYYSPEELDELDDITNALAPILDEIYQLKSYVEQKTYNEIVKKIR